MNWRGEKSLKDLHKPDIEKNKCQWALCNWRPIKKKAKAEIEG